MGAAVGSRFREYKEEKVPEGQNWNLLFSAGTFCSPNLSLQLQNNNYKDYNFQSFKNQGRIERGSKGLLWNFPPCSIRNCIHCDSRSAVAKQCHWTMNILIVLMFQSPRNVLLLSPVSSPDELKMIPAAEQGVLINVAIVQEGRNVTLRVNETFHCNICSKKGLCKWQP